MTPAGRQPKLASTRIAARGGRSASPLAGMRGRQRVRVRGDEHAHEDGSRGLGLGRFLAGRQAFSAHVMTFLLRSRAQDEESARQALRVSKSAGQFDLLLRQPR